MDRVKSRNMILVVCGAFFFLIISFSIFLGILKIIDNLEENSIYDNIILKSSKVEVSGEGNFYESTPKVSNTTVKDFNVKLKKQGDSAKFVAEFCNDGSDDLLIDTISYDEVICNDGMYDILCQGLEFNGYVNKSNDRFNQGQCIEFIVEVKNLINRAKSVIVSINEYELGLMKINNK